MIPCSLVLAICLRLGKGIYHAMLAAIFATVMPHDILACGYLSNCCHALEGALCDY